MTDKNKPRHPYYISTALVTRLADKLGWRRHMMILAFQDGLYGRKSYNNAPKAVEFGSALGAVVAAVGILAERTGAEGEISTGTMISAALTITALGGMYVFTNTFRAASKATAQRMETYLRENTLDAIDTVIGAERIWQEADMYLLGRGIDSMTDYINRYGNQLLKKRDQKASKTIFDQALTDESHGVKAEAGRLHDMARAQTLQDDHLQRQQLEITYGKLSETLAFLQKNAAAKIKPGDRAYINDIVEPNTRKMQALGLIPQTAPALRI